MIELRKISALLILLIPLALNAQEETPSRTLITNVNIFDGFSDKLANGMSVLIEDNRIVEVGMSISAPGATVIDGGGRTMTPGLIDMHQHVMLNPPDSYADILLWEGNPLENIDLILDEDRLHLVIKDGGVYKNMLD